VVQIVAEAFNYAVYTNTNLLFYITEYFHTICWPVTGTSGNISIVACLAIMSYITKKY